MRNGARVDAAIPARYEKESIEQSREEKVIVFTRYPESGLVKTRLAPVLGLQGAAELHRLMTEHIIRRVRRLQGRRDISVQVLYYGGSRVALSRWLGQDLDYRSQEGNDLGERMLLAFKQAFSTGSQRVLIIGSDCPGITCEAMEKALNLLRDHDLVLGPASDGGYYMIGLKEPLQHLFADMPWGTGDVFRLTMEAARNTGLSTRLLETLNDVDRPEDLGIWHDFRASEDHPTGKEGVRLDRISVIIPTLNEAESLPATLASIGSLEDFEIIVTDGGSTDDTVSIAESSGAKVLQGPKGRSAQMNRGALAATGDILVFLHGDTWLPVDWAHHVRTELGAPNVSGGAFRFRTDGEQWSFRLIERLANFRAAKLHMPYGDQVLFVKADVFHRIGGMPDLPLMEDFEFVRRLRKLGQVRIAPADALTSSRRWQRYGIWRTSFMNQVIILSYFIGVPPKALVRLRGTDACEVTED